MSKTKSKPLIPIFLIIFLIAGLAAAGIYFGIFKQTTLSEQCKGSITILSIDRVDFIDDGEINPKIQVLASSRGSGQCLQIRFNKEAMQGKLGQGLTKDAEEKIANIVMQEEKRIYRTRKESDIYILSSKDAITLSCSATFCNSKFAGTIADSDRLVGSCFCAVGARFGAVGDFASGESDFKAAVEISGFSPQIITKLSSPQVRFGELAQVQWVGSLGSTELPVTPTYDIFYDASNNIRIVAEAARTIPDKFSSFQQDNYFHTCTIPTASCFRSNIDKYNEDVQRLTQDRETNLRTDSPSIIKIEKDSVNNRVIIFDEPGSVQIQLFTFILDAEWVGVRRVSGVPKLSCNDVGNVNGGRKNIEFALQNIGGSAGSFDLTGNCDIGGISLGVNRVTLQKGENKNINAVISGVQDKDQGFTCNVKAIDVNSGKSDSCAFRGTFKKFAGCNEGERLCIGKSLGLCVNGEYKYSDCPEDCAFLASGAQCIGDSRFQPPKTGSGFFQNLLSNIKGFFVILGILSLLVIGLFIWILLKRGKK